MADERRSNRQVVIKHLIQAAIGLGGALIFVALSYTDFYTVFESRLLDQRFLIRGPIPMHPRVKTIDIDAFTLASEGRIQDWDRDKHAKIIPMLKELKARMIGYDYYFVEPSARTLSFKQFQEAGVGSPEDLERLFPDYDAEMCRLMAEAGNVILGQTVNDNAPTDPASQQEAIRRLEPYYKELPDAESTTLVKSVNIETPLPEMISASKGVGMAMTVADIDGSVRHYPLVQVYDGKAFPALALAMICEYIGVSFKEADIVPGAYLSLPEGKLPDGSPIKVRIPIDERGRMIVNWAGRWDEPDFEHIPHLAVSMYHEGRFDESIVQAIKKTFHSHPDTYVNEDSELMVRQLAEAGFDSDTFGEKIELLYYTLLYAKKLEEEVIAAGTQLTEAEVPEDIWSLYNTLKINHDVYTTMQENPSISRAELETKFGRDHWRDIQSMYHVMQDKQATGGLQPDDFPLYFMPVSIGDRFMTDDDFADGVFFYGLTAAGTWDLNPMPYEDRYPMLGLHANAFNTILTGQYLKRLSHHWNIVVMLTVGLIMGLFIGKFKPLTGALILALLFGGYLAGAQVFFQQFGYWVDVLGPVAALVAAYMGITAYNFFSEEKEKKMIRGIFSRYVTKSVVDELIKNPDMVKLGGERKELTVFFSDVAGFTTVSESLTPEELVGLLNEYLTAMTNIVLRYDGMIDKYEGDAIMAVFGTPIPYTDHAYRACIVSLEMQKELINLRAQWKAQGRPELKARIGLNTGPMIAGNMGAADRLDYTVMGDSVNLGSRLEGANKEYGTYIMISEFTREQCKDRIETRFLDSLRVKGKLKPVRVYEVLGASDNGYPVSTVKRKAVEVYEQGLQLYLKQEWDQAIRQFEAAIGICPDDSPSEVYRSRCEVFKKNPPGPDWDGVFVMTTK